MAGHQRAHTFVSPIARAQLRGLNPHRAERGRHAAAALRRALQRRSDNAPDSSLVRYPIGALADWNESAVRSAAWGLAKLGLFTLALEQAGKRLAPSGGSTATIFASYSSIFYRQRKRRRAPCLGVRPGPSA